MRRADSFGVKNWKVNIYFQMKNGVKKLKRKFSGVQTQERVIVK